MNLGPTSLPVVVAILASFAAADPARAGVIYASGQLLIENDDGTHDDERENRIFRIDTTTGVATPVSPLFDGSTPAALGGTRSGELVGIRSGQLGSVDIGAGEFNPVGDPTGEITTAFDIMSDGRGFLLPFNDDFETQQLFSVDLATAVIGAVGSSTAIGDAIDAAAGNAPGTAEPFLISLGSVGDRLYGVDLDSDSLIVIDPDTGAAGVVGDVGAVGASNGGRFFGFSAMTGVDEDRDGAFDALFGAVNFGPSGERLGGLARFDLTDGTWDLVGTNPGLIYFGFGASVVPEPGALTLSGLGLVAALGLAWRLRRRARRPTPGGVVRASRPRLGSLMAAIWVALLSGFAASLAGCGGGQYSEVGSISVGEIKGSAEQERSASASNEASSPEDRAAADTNPK